MKTYILRDPKTVEPQSAARKPRHQLVAATTALDPPMNPPCQRIGRHAVLSSPRERSGFVRAAPNAGLAAQFGRRPGRTDRKNPFACGVRLVPGAIARQERQAAR